MTRVPRTLGENVQSAMARAGIKTQSELAERMGAPKGQVSAWLSDPNANVELRTLFRFAKALRVSIESLVVGIDGDYDAMRRADDSPDRLAELCGRLPADERAFLVALLERRFFAEPVEP